jgi:hypothetical protein
MDDPRQTGRFRVKDYYPRKDDSLTPWVLSVFFIALAVVMAIVLMGCTL